MILDEKRKWLDITYVRGHQKMIAGQNESDGRIAIDDLVCTITSAA